MSKFLRRNLGWLFLLLVLILLASHALSLEWVTVDNTTLLLLILLLLSPFIEKLKKVKWGEFEAEIGSEEVEKVKSEVDRKLGEVAGEVESALPPQVGSTSGTLLALVDTDHILALAKLRIELEKMLRRLYRAVVSDSRERTPPSLGRLVSALVEAEVLPGQLSNPFREVAYLANRAIHGAEVSREAARSIVALGIRLLQEVAPLIDELITKPIESHVISPQEVESYSGARYRVTTVVPLVHSPFRNVRLLTQEGLDSLLDGYGEYAEFLVAIERVDQ